MVHHITFSVRDALSFLFPDLQALIITKLLSFVTIFLSIRSYSRVFYMVVHQGFFSFFNCSSRSLSKFRSTKLYSQINMVLNTCLFWGVQVFFLHIEVQFFLPYLLRWCYVILDNFPSCFMIRKLLRMRYLNPSFLPWNYLGLYFT